jgi:hypothetical protein
MSRIFITGDTHGTFNRFNSTNFEDGRELTKNDFVIVLGDFGLIWNYLQSDKQEEYWKRWLTEKPWTTLFVDGNHECHPRLNELPEEELFGGKVGKVSDSIYHLKRGEVFNIADKKFFVMGGALSIDKENRINHVSWWKEELPSFKETENGINNLEKHNNEVNYVLSHTGPLKCVKYILDNQRYSLFDLSPEKVKDPTVDYLDHIDEIVTFDKWYFGHMHSNKSMFDKYQCLYEDIIEL